MIVTAAKSGLIKEKLEQMYPKVAEIPFYARTIAFTTLMMLQMYNVMNCRSSHTSAFKGLFSNMWLLGAILSSIILQVLIIYTPLRDIFSTTPISLGDWGYILLISASVLVFGEIVKLISKFLNFNH